MAHLINFVSYKFFQSIDIYSTESIVLNFVVAQIFVFLTYAGHLDSCLIFWHVSWYTGILHNLYLYFYSVPPLNLSMLMVVV